MLLGDIKFKNFETVKVKCVLYSKDGKRAVSHWLKLYPIENITRQEPDKGFYLEVRKYEYCTEYIVWNDCEKRIAVEFCNVDEDYRISELSELLHRNVLYKGSEGYKMLLEQREENKKFISLADVAALKFMGETVLAEHYRQYREKYLKQKEQEDMENRKKMEIEQKRREEEQQKAIERKLAEAEERIRNNEMVQNEELDNGKRIILCLMKKYDIKVPLKTQGWINNKLVNVTFEEGGEVSLRFYRHKGCKCSDSVYRYLRLLREAVVDAA